MKVMKFAAVLLLAVGMFSATAIAAPGDDCASAVAAPGSLDPCLGDLTGGPLTSPGDCGGVGGAGLGGGSLYDVWVSFVATATAHRVTTDPSPSGTDSSFVVWDACPPGGNKIGCGEDISYVPGSYNFLGDTCVGGLTIGAPYYVQLGAWAAGGTAAGPGYMGSCGVYDVTIGAATGGTCGDGTISCVPSGNPGAEGCDDTNLVDGDGCDSNCTPTGCGNGILTAGEVCDDGNLANGDGCDSNCTPTACGNGVVSVSTGEQCDDGNLTDGDGCSSTCQLPICGDGIVDVGEDCDPPGSLGAPCPAGGSCNSICKCLDGIPAVSEWGLAVLTLIGLVSGTILFGRRREAVR
jgi:cysteine-rich repeat protein